MLVVRNGVAPQVHQSAQIAASAQLVGNVAIGAGAYVDHGAVIESSGPLIRVGEEAIVLQGAVLGDDVRVGAGAIVHATTVLPAKARVGMRHVAVPTPDGFLSTADVERAREVVAGAEFFETAFGTAEPDQARLHARVMDTLLEEAHGWQDEPLPSQP